MDVHIYYVTMTYIVNLAANSCFLFYVNNETVCSSFIFYTNMYLRVMYMHMNYYVSVAYILNLPPIFVHLCPINTGAVAFLHIF